MKYTYKIINPKQKKIMKILYEEHFKTTCIDL